MTRLQRWMTLHAKRDSEVARAVRLSRVQISRLRRGLGKTSETSARRLEKLTGIRWYHFLESLPRRQAKR